MKNLTKFRMPAIAIRSLAILSAGLLILLSAQSTSAQKDTVFKNTIRINITNPMLFGDKSTILGYERILKNNQSFSIGLGRASFPIPKLSTDDSMELQNDYKEQGFHISGDYRFYLKSLNKHDAPRGVYIGPYYSMNYFKRTNTWSLSTSGYNGELETELSFGIQSVGFQLGYQFVFWKRLSVDMILLGPGIALYRLKASTSTSIPEEDKQALYEKPNDFLSDKFPGYNYVITGDGFEKSGVENTTSLGFRYVVMLGVRF